MAIILPEPSAAGLLRAHRDACATVRAKVSQFALAYWDNMPNIRQPAVEEMVAALVPLVEAGQLQIAHLTDTYLRAMARKYGLADPGLAVDAAALKDLRGVPASEVYRRPAVSAYSALARDAGISSALSAGRTRLEQIIGTDMQMAKVHQAHRSFSGWKPPGGATKWTRRPQYRRVPQGSYSCALCLIASTQRYWLPDLLPIHPGCDCEVEPLPLDHPMGIEGHVIDKEFLEQIHDAVERETGTSDRGARLPDYRKLIIVREHGEYGPVLAYRIHDFTKKRDAIFVKVPGRPTFTAPPDVIPFYE